MLNDQLTRDLNTTLNRLTGELGAVTSTLKQHEKTLGEVKEQITEVNKNINQNNITIARATGFVSALSFVISTVTALTLKYLKFI